MKIALEKHHYIERCGQQTDFLVDARIVRSDN